MEVSCCGLKFTVPKDCVLICEDDCSWQIGCEKVDVKGKPEAAQPPPDGGHAPTVTVEGDLQRTARSLSTVFDRQVVVPAALRGKSVPQRSITGTPEEIVEALGLRFR